MSFSFPSFILCIAALATASIARAETPAPGEYETPQGWGTLSVRNSQGGALSFEIQSIGANAHMCDLSGKIKGDKGYTDEEGAAAGEAPCVISFRAVPAGYSVSAETGDACRAFCGARAWFEGDYLAPPPGCKPAERAEQRAGFASQYRAKDYHHAYDTLDAFYQRCGKFLNWVEIDKVRNDLAVTQYHLGHKDACLAILRDTIGARETNEQELSLPPADLDAYLPGAQATWFNLKLCGKGAKPPAR